jgi:hypothetical protein
VLELAARAARGAPLESDAIILREPGSNSRVRQRVGAGARSRPRRGDDVPMRRHVVRQLNGGWFSSRRNLGQDQDGAVVGLVPEGPKVPDTRVEDVDVGCVAA